jgi:pimeloyl-ACP methyl ester carboxylesterase
VRLKKFAKYAAACVAALCLLALGALFVSSELRRAGAAPDALAAMNPDDRVEISDDGWVVFRPRGRTPDTGVILYPGANCDVRGYAPVLRPLAEQGYLVVDLRMPFDFAIFAPNRALAVKKAFPSIRRWVLIGHSMGGAMAAMFVHDHPDAVAELVVWDSYPPGFASLADARIPVWHVHRATPDGRPPASFAERRGLYPATSTWVPIPGGIHMYFGSFVGGAYQEQWTPSISREAQHAQVTDATLRALRALAPGAGP